MAAQLKKLVQSAKDSMPDFVRVGYRLCRRGALFIPGQLIGTITHVSTHERIAALTFDDGPHPEFTPRLLEVLEHYGARATFFMVGESASRYPELVRRIADAGHAIGNHSWDHPSFPAITSRERVRQIRACEEVIGSNGQKLFRPPFGNQTFRSRLDALRLGYRVVAWNVVGSDWKDDSPEVVFERLARRLGPGSILLLHDALFTVENERFASRESTIGAVRLLLERYAHEYRFVTVPELLRMGRQQKTWWYQPGDAGYLAGLRRTRI